VLRITVHSYTQQEMNTTAGGLPVFLAN
jgi:hypothetical protein